jgi:hypothetical protein
MGPQGVEDAARAVPMGVWMPAAPRCGGRHALNRCTEWRLLLLSLLLPAACFCCPQPQPGRKEALRWAHACRPVCQVGSWGSSR